MRKTQVEEGQKALKAFLSDARSFLDYMQSKFEETQVWIRCVIRTDIVIGSHLTRTFATAKNVFALSEQGDFFDASALSRVVVEHMVSLAFLITREDVDKACDDFALDGLSHTVQRFAALQKHYPKRFVASPAQSQKEGVVRELIREIGFSTSLFNQVTTLQTDFPNSAFSFLADVLYSDLSVHTHPRVHCLSDLAPEQRRPYTMAFERRHTQNAVAAFIALVCCTDVANAASTAWRLGLTEDFLARLTEILDRYPDIGSGVFPEQFDIPALDSRSALSTTANKKARQKKKGPNVHP